MSEIKPSDDGSYLIGVISDTHGVVSDEATEALQGVSLIIHAGDADEIEVLEQLARIAPVSAVRGNMDRGPGLSALPISQVNQLGDVTIFTIHDLAQLDLDPVAAGFDLVIYGHYHRPELVERGGVTFLNPGSTSFPRMGSKMSLALVRIWDGKIDVELINLE